METNTIYRISKGDEQAFDTFMDECSSALYHYAYGILGNHQLTEEVVSDVFLEVWKNRKGLLEIESMKAWLRTVTYHKAVSTLRHESTIPEGISLDEIESFRISPLNAPDEAMISREEIDSLNRAIESLPPKCRHVFFLAKIDCRPYKEIAEMLQISVATVNYHVGYAMEALKKILTLIALTLPIDIFN